MINKEYYRFVSFDIKFTRQGFVLGDDALISKGSFMQTKYLCVLIHI